MIDGRFHPEARADFMTAAARYATGRPDLGQAFYRRIGELVTEIEAAPTLRRIDRPPQARRHFRRPSPYTNDPTHSDFNHRLHGHESARRQQSRTTGGFIEYSSLKSGVETPVPKVRLLRAAGIIRSSASSNPLTASWSRGCTFSGRRVTGSPGSRTEVCF